MMYGPRSLWVIVLLLLTGTAHSFKIESHVWLANEILKEMQANQGRIAIEGRLYTPDIKVRNALTSPSGRGAFLLGVMGADIYPDMLAGQMTMHPGVAATAGGKVAWQTDDWLQFVLDRATVSGNPDSLAFAVGYTLHAAMDMWAHTYVNGYAGEVFSIMDYPEVAERHVALEAYLKTFHKTLISDDNDTQDTWDAYSPLHVPAEFVADTLILNKEVAEQYWAEPTTRYLAAIWRYQQGFVDLEDIADDIAADIANEIERIEPILESIRSAKVDVEKHRAVYEGHLQRLTQGAAGAIDWAAGVAEGSGLLGVVEGVTGDIDLDDPAQGAKNILERALATYQNSVNQLSYGIDGMLDVDKLKQSFQNAAVAVSGSMAVAMRHNIRLAMIAYIRAWEETAKELMRPHGSRFSPGSDFKQPMIHWAQCWAPLLGMPLRGLPAAGAGSCQRTMEGLADFEHARAVLKDNIGDYIPGIAKLKDDIEAFDEYMLDLVNQKAKSITNSMASVVPGGSPDSPDVVGLVNWLFSMWDKNPSANDVNVAFSDSASKVPYVAYPVAAAVHKDLNVCTGKQVASSLTSAPVKDFAPMQNAVTMSKLALLPAAELNRLVQALEQTSGGSQPKTSKTLASAQLTNANLLAVYPTTRPGGKAQPPAGAVLLGALRSIDGDHQWLPVAPPPARRRGAKLLNVKKQCRRFGYPASGPYLANVDCADPFDDAQSELALKPGFRIAHGERYQQVFERLFRPVNTHLCSLLAHLKIETESCVAGLDFPIYSPLAATQEAQPTIRTRPPPDTRRQPPTVRNQANRQQSSLRRMPRTRAAATTATMTTSQQAPGTGAESTLVTFDRFQAGATSHDWANSYLLALLSYVSYPGALNQGEPSKAQLAAQLKEWQLQFIDWLDITAKGHPSGSTQVLVAANKDALIFAFRGSTITPQDLAQDWYDNNLDVAPHPLPAWGRGVVLHRGFFEAGSLVFDRVAQIVQQHGKGRQVWLTGHSLGGANAVLNAFELNRRKLETQGVYVFGSPPVGNAAWRQAYHSKVPNTHRWSVQNDPVSSVMVQLPGPFTHVGYRNNLRVDGKVDLAHSKEFKYPLSGGAKDIVRDLAKTHMSYWCRIRTAAERFGGVQNMPVPPNSECDLCRF